MHFARLGHLYSRLVKPLPPADPKLERWKEAGFGSPPPHSVKFATLLSHGIVEGSWIESGTYLGQMTRLLAASFPSVITIKPQEHLVSSAVETLVPLGNVTVLAGTSEELLEVAINRLRSPSANFWLDGHYSGQGTYQGTHQTPIISELETIRKKRKSFARIMVFVDDFRLFTHEPLNATDYPTRTTLVQWADSLGFGWSVENDIFIAGTEMR
jgi:hypothetical protein